METVIAFLLMAFVICIIIIRGKSKDNDDLSASLSKERTKSDTLNKELHDLKKTFQDKTESYEKGLHQAQEKYEAELSLLQLSHLRTDKSVQNKFNELPNNKFRYVASLMADYLTYNISKKERSLAASSKYHERERAAKVREIKEETKAIITELKEAQYQLDYLLQTYPELNDVINYSGTSTPSFEEMEAARSMYNDDPVSGYISREEWGKLAPSERNQLALDRYLQRKKNNWEIGRDYELYVAHCYEAKGYSVDTFGSYMRLQDLGRDLIAKKDGKVLVIQCKCWSTEKAIRENSICQLYGTVICYCIENKRKTSDVTPVFITSTQLSEKAKEFADMLGITVVENFPLKEFPRIKCNVGHEGKIYHLPIDALYDQVKISKIGECYCYSVKEAEQKGFRRAYRWHGNT